MTRETDPSREDPVASIITPFLQKIRATGIRIPDIRPDKGSYVPVTQEELRNLCQLLIPPFSEDLIGNASDLRRGRVESIPKVVYWVQTCLQHVDPKISAPELLKAAAAAEDHIQSIGHSLIAENHDTYAKRVLVYLGDLVAPVLADHLLSQEDYGNEKIGSITLYVLEQIKSKDIVPKLLPALKSGTDMAINVLSILRKTGDQRAVIPVIDLLSTSRDVFFTVDIIQTLMELKDKRAVEPLLDLIRRNYCVYDALRALQEVVPDYVVPEVVEIALGKQLPQETDSDLLITPKSRMDAAKGVLEKIVGGDNSRLNEVKILAEGIIGAEHNTSKQEEMRFLARDLIIRIFERMLEKKTTMEKGKLFDEPPKLPARNKGKLVRMQRARRVSSGK